MKRQQKRKKTEWKKYGQERYTEAQRWALARIVEANDEGMSARGLATMITREVLDA